MPDIEERLRESLQARASDVTPEPAMFRTVQSRISRRRTVRYALAGATAALAIAGVALAAPGLLDRRIEFEPGPVATQPPGDAVDNVGVQPLPSGTDVVFTDGARLFAHSREGDVPVAWVGTPQICVDESCEPSLPVAAFDMAADGDGDFHVAAVDVECDAMTFHIVTGHMSRGGIVAPAQGCVTRPVFSPDDDAVAWASRLRSGEWVLNTAAWSDGALAGTATAALPWSGDTTVDVQEWVWTEETDTSATGYIVVRTQRDGGVQLLRLPIERDENARYHVTLDAGLVTTGSAATPLAFAASGPDVTYTLEAELAPDGPVNGTIVRRVDDEAVGAVDLPPELFDAPFEFESLWMSAAGDTVLYGNAEQRLAWLVEWSTDRFESHVLVKRAVVHGVVLPTQSDDVAAPTEQPTTEPTTVDVYFGMAGADACVADQLVTRDVVGPGVARAALTQLLAGPTGAERGEGIASPFGPGTAGALNAVAIVDGEARVDFADLSSAVDDDSCTKSAILDALDKTLLQFPTITSTRYSFDGDVEAFEQWLGQAAEPMSDIPAAVAETAEQVHAAASDRSYRALRRLMPPNFSCTYSDQPEGPGGCIAYWRSLEEQGQDPLGTLAELLEGPPGHVEDARMWVWPAGWAAPGAEYSGHHRTGIGAEGTWRYYNQPGG